MILSYLARLTVTGRLIAMTAEDLFMYDPGGTVS